MRSLIRMSIFAALVAAIPVASYAADAKPAASEKKSEGRFAKTDTDQNGKLSKSEFMGEAEARFKDLDANGDGSITREEMQAHRDKMRAMRDQRRGQKPAQ